MISELKLLQTRLGGKRTLVLFRTKPYQPVLVPFIYLILRLKAKSFSTTKQKLSGVKLLYEFFSEKNSYDVDELLINKRHQIIIKDFEQLVNWITYKEDILGYRARHLYLQGICEFVEWAFNRYGTTDFANISMKGFLKSFTRSIPPSVLNTDSLLTDEDVRLILKFSNPISIENPFREKLKNRNFLIINIFLSTGVRLSELLKLKSSDIHSFDGRYYLEILNHEGDELDSRSDEPGLKNSHSKRVVSISEELYNALEDYIRRERRPVRFGIKLKLQHGYLFTSERGLPLAKSSVDYIIKTLGRSIRSNNKNFMENLHPHLFRHYFSECYLAYLIDCKGLDMEHAKDKLRAIGGWSVSSEMPVYYARKYVARTANAYNLERLKIDYRNLN